MPVPSCKAFFLDVGQGHATLFAAGGEALLIDCPFSGRSAVLDQMAAMAGPVRLEAIITHRDLDHCAGVRAVMQQRPFDVLYLNAAWALAPTGPAGARVRAVIRGLIDQAEMDGTDLRPATEGDTGSAGPIEWQVMSPPYSWVVSAALNDSTNRSSVVVMLTILGHRVLVPGDADATALRRLLDSDHDLAADVLLLPHHGADVTHLGEFVSRVGPKLAVISAGRSAGIHPTEPTLAILAAAEDCRMACTQVGLLCHSDALPDPTCAGTVTCTITSDGITTTPDTTAHGLRIGSLDSARCTPAPMSAVVL